MPVLSGQALLDSLRRAAPLSRHEQQARALGYLVTLSAILAGVYVGHFAASLLWLALYALCYPYLSHTLSRLTPVAQHALARTVLLQGDALNVGVALVLLEYALVPSLLMIAVLLQGALLIGGARLGLLSLSSLFAVAFFAAHLLGISIQLDSPWPVNLTGLLVASVYFVLGAYFSHRQTQRLAATQAILDQERHQSAERAANLARYLAPQVWQSIFNGEKSARLETQRKKLTVFFSDIRGFSELSEELEAETLTDMLNTYLDDMSKIALKYGGTIDKFIGDSVMIFFGDPSSRGPRSDAIAAVTMAIAMRKHMKVLRQQWRAQGILNPMEIRMGINTGYCTVGNFGTETRMDYTIIGSEVNLASRLESAAESGEILISHETFAHVRDVVICSERGMQTFKGFSRPMRVYQVMDLRSELGVASRYLEFERTGFSMYLDIDTLPDAERERVIHALQQAANRLRNQLGGC
ncbi:adenylate/guanylate cyclase domain-containing protein [Pseudomonas sp. NW5]|uniref:adenylate/guanylate cyclase domain-containing protein n=1 Tax=Pseudomonas sp. NW5 TaxID=2934934 RepID=UPI002020937E|nr:adenylate/guanylate cyclase domain-containing protein [Pseudomonas sp. NW5]MCL7462060.1 adenylate cyclase [Pseudomonas sp. NW5]